ncbi:MAG: sensor histidine kinase [Nitrospinae bacterium]|nr:sensor histidine kinase [Nitrospinota bacterium]
MGSLKARLTAGLSLGLVILFALQWVVVAGAIRKVAEDYARSRLEHDVETLLTAVSFDGRGSMSINGGLVNTVYQRPFSGHYYRIWSDGFVARSRSLWDEELPDETQPVGGKSIGRAPGPQGQTLITFTASFQKQGRVVRIAVAEDVTSMEAGLSAFRREYALMSAGALAIIIFAQYILVGMGLKPLFRARDDVLRLERGLVPAIGEDVPAEAKPLVMEINRLLAIMSARLERSRKALGNLSHAIKTPLSILSQISDGQTTPQSPSAREEVDRNIRVIHELVERNLAKARLAGSISPGGMFEPEKEIPELVSTLEKMYREKDLRILWRLNGDKKMAPADREDMVELIGALMDNACKWARAGVELSIEISEGTHIIVEDDGPGCPAELMEKLAKRGARLDESVVGHGLGLSIASDIVESYSGALSFGRSGKLKGFRADAMIPGSGMKVGDGN